MLATTATVHCSIPSQKKLDYWLKLFPDLTLFDETQLCI
jgi:hypothetical protein